MRVLAEPSAVASIDRGFRQNHCSCQPPWVLFWKEERNLKRCPSATPDILIGEIAKHRHIDLVLSKALRVLGHASFSSQSETRCFAAAPRTIGLMRPHRRVYPTNPPSNRSTLRRAASTDRGPWMLAGRDFAFARVQQVGRPACPSTATFILIPVPICCHVRLGPSGTAQGGSRGNAVCSSLHTHGRV
jgi:hypothetical protein